MRQLGVIPPVVVDLETIAADSPGKCATTYHRIDVANMMMKKESAVSSRVVIGKPILTRWISMTKYQKAWKSNNS